MSSGSKKQILKIGDDSRIEIVGRRIKIYGEVLFCFLSIITGGVFYLLGRWFPKIFASVVSVETSFSDSTHLLIKNEHKQFSFVKVNSKVLDNGEKRTYFDYHCCRFFFNPETSQFLSQFEMMESIPLDALNGLDSLSYDERILVYGSNVIDVEEKSWGQVLIDEVLHPFNIFQVYSITLWCLDDYYLYASCIFIMSCASAISTLLETKKNIHMLRMLSRFACDVKVLRSGQWTTMSSEFIAPGDIIELSNDLSSMPCDAILLNGDVIMNESMLTGESVPIIKTGLENVSSISNIKLNVWDSELEAKSIIYSGTKFIRIKANSEDETPLAMVYRTGFNTTKGQLIRGIIYPKPHKFKFYRDAFKFVGVLALIALIGFGFSLYYFITKKAAIHLIIKRALDLFTIVVPPALPATMSIGTTFALGRLRRSQIFCISPTRVNIGGKLNIFVFDKTGTLTEEGLDVLGVHCVSSGNQSMSELFVSPEKVSESMTFAMASCQAIKVIDSKTIGDPLDLKMFEFTKWALEEGIGGSESAVSCIVRSNRQVIDVAKLLSELEKDSPGILETCAELGIIRSFDFSSKLRRMSVVVKRLHSKDTLVFAKGAPEVISQICKPESLPHDFEAKLKHYVHNGYRVIACAGRRLSKETSWLQVQKMERDEIESNLDFYGLIVFENKLKPASSPTLKILNNANLTTVMCTGDNVLTAVSVSRECGILSREKHVFFPKITGESPPSIVWECLDDEKLVLNPETLLPVTNDVACLNSLNDFDIACCGDTYEFILENMGSDVFDKLLVMCKVYARMSPDLKQNLVEKLQDLGYYVGFVGDGSNDCGALKAADVGMSLSSAEASVAAPFTSTVSDISCSLDIIKEGRAALVTSFSCFKYMALYSMIQFTTISLLYLSLSSLNDLQFLYIDLMLIFPIAVAMGRFPASRKIVPKRPTANLLSRKVLVSLIGQIILQAVFQSFILVFTLNQDWFKEPEMDPEETNVENHLNTSLFLISIFQYVIVGFDFVVGRPYQQSIPKNRAFVIIFLLLILLNIFLVFSAVYPELKRFGDLFLFDPIPWWHGVTICSTAALYFLLSWFSEKILFAYISRFFKYLSQAKSRWKYHQSLRNLRNIENADQESTDSQKRLMQSNSEIDLWKYRKPYKRIKACLGHELKHRRRPSFDAATRV